ncbi:hypothetical protein M2103_002045, partial [Ereboglobus sp. PH5-5]|nr:hypothetical protein [Ereboglobus sp. PH5-5]
RLHLGFQFFGSSGVVPRCYSFKKCAQDSGRYRKLLGRQAFRK